MNVFAINKVGCIILNACPEPLLSTVIPVVEDAVVTFKSVWSAATSPGSAETV